MKGEQLPTHGSVGKAKVDVAQSRTVRFSGVMRQSEDVLPPQEQQGAGHYLLPPLKGAANQESRTGDIRFQRLPE